MTFFIRTQLYGIGRCKRLLGTLLFAPALLLFCSYYAINSWIDTQLVLAMFAALVAMLSSEILHWLTVDEIKDGLFDIILISPVSRFKILLNKTVVPIVCSLCLTLVSLLLNNFLSSYDRFVGWNFSFATCSFLFFASIFSALLEFISLLVIRRNNTNIHFLLLSGGIFLMLWVYDLISKNLILFYTVIISFTVLAVSLSLILLRLRYRVSVKRNGYCLRHLFGDNKISVFGAFFRKNLSTIRCGKVVLIQFIIAAFSPILMVVIANAGNFIHLNAIVILLFSAIPSVTNIHIVFYSSLFENRNKINEILQIRDVTAVKRIIEKAVSAGVISSVLCAVSFLVIALFCTHGALFLPLSVANCFVSAIICGIYSHKIHSFKAENIHKAVISLISVAFQCMFLLFM